MSIRLPGEARPSARHGPVMARARARVQARRAAARRTGPCGFHPGAVLECRASERWLTVVRRRGRRSPERQRKAVPDRGEQECPRELPGARRWYHWSRSPASPPSSAPRAAALRTVAVPQGRTGPRPRGPSSTARTRGSQIMPLVWFEALKQPNGEPFAAATASPLRLPAQPDQPHARPAGRLHRQRLGRPHHGRHDLRRLPHARSPPAGSSTGSTAGRRSSISSASSRTSTPRSARWSTTARRSRPSPTRCSARRPRPTSRRPGKRRPTWYLRFHTLVEGPCPTRPGASAAWTPCR